MQALTEIWPPSWPSPWIPLLVIAAVIGLALGARLAGWRQRRRRIRASAHGRRMEERAPAALERRGYRVIERHPVVAVEWFVDGAPQPLELEPDLLVARGGRRFLVEVKTGGATRAERRDTRRQLLEYAAYAPVDGVLLYDADRDELRAVEFPIVRRPTGGWAIAAALAIGLALGGWATAWWLGR